MHAVVDCHPGCPDWQEPPQTTSEVDKGVNSEPYRETEPPVRDFVLELELHDEFFSRRVPGGGQPSEDRRNQAREAYWRVYRERQEAWGSPRTCALAALAAYERVMAE